ncbi:DUF1801 domain-containing protein [Flavobacterium facile]|uniref:DUF1801 domain-containing protein n=1 Tax=Flavobacterium facile TaxID=2893174 RepID=UPI002E79AFD2|nr:DUF1801 domain-containing protein [Flavobacterium sp. T-12]
MKPSEEYILKQSPEFQEIIYYVISVIEQEMDTIELLFKWGIPYFYYDKKPFIYIAPNKSKGFVDIGFAKGYELTVHQDVLIGEKRNTIKSLRYFKIDSIKDKVLREVIQEAKLLHKKT